MIDLATISNQVDLGKVYYNELLDDQYEDLLNGCSDCCDSKYNCLSQMITALSVDIDDDINTDNTQSVYFQLLNLMADFSGSYSPDPNVVLPETTIIISSSDRPEPVVIEYSDMTLDGTRYDNATWAGFNPLMQLEVVTQLYRGTDYDLLPTGGFILNPSGNVPAIFEGQEITVYNYNIA